MSFDSRDLLVWHSACDEGASFKTQFSSMIQWSESVANVPRVNFLKDMMFLYIPCVWPKCSPFHLPFTSPKKIMPCPPRRESSMTNSPPTWSPWAAYVYVYIYISLYGQDGWCCPAKWILPAQGQCFMHFGKSARWQLDWRDLFPKHKTLNPKTYINLTWNPK